MGSSPALDQIYFCVDFFGFVRFFFAIILMSPKGPPFIFVLFCKRIDVEKQPKGPFYIFRYNATYQKLQKNRIFFNYFPHVLLLYLSIGRRYGADLGRSRVVSSCNINCRNRRLLVSRKSNVPQSLEDTTGSFGKFAWSTVCSVENVLSSFMLGRTPNSNLPINFFAKATKRQKKVFFCGF